jgi:hypothetical protein
MQDYMREFMLVPLKMNFEAFPVIGKTEPSPELSEQEKHSIVKQLESDTRIRNHEERMPRAPWQHS